MTSRNGNVLVSDSFHDGTREHPAMKWMEKSNSGDAPGVANRVPLGREFIDTNDRTDAPQWYSPKFVYVSGDGVETGGGAPAWNKMYDEYDSFFKEYHHEPYSIVCFESDGSHDSEYEMVGQAQLYGNLVGEHDGLPKVTNPKDGREWDVVRPGAWHFWYEKTDDPKHNGYQLSRLQLMMDSGPVLARLMHRGEVKHTDLIDKHVLNK